DREAQGLRDVAGAVRAVSLDDGVDAQPAGGLAAGRAAHAVADDVEPALRGQLRLARRLPAAEGGLVGLADHPDVGQAAAQALRSRHGADASAHASVSKVVLAPSLPVAAADRTRFTATSYRTTSIRVELQDNR